MNRDTLKRFLRVIYTLDGLDYDKILLEEFMKDLDEILDRIDERATFTIPIQEKRK